MTKRYSVTWLLPAAMLVIALLRLPYGYYTALRIVVSLAACYLVYVEYKRSGLSGWAALFVGIAAVFNPILPAHFTRGVWAVIDLATAAAFAIHWRRSTASQRAAT